ncbi:carboxypeptidase-like regulatory domain-containing protein [uncultured Polaribacter sp.]|uniref:carboxypeptidase-like regulatory domain-containing protein n=2 Tax=Polaribacter TaxID=52959 RepID=UPI0026170B46|nr:carboxypeptidase-like regulatory domain-containing protein [uncultured Polaribacter sp.]
MKFVKIIVNMQKKLLLLFLLAFVVSSSFSQLRRTIINGKVTDSLSTVRNANIINLKTNQGTFTSDNGEFRIFVKEGDSLRFSSVQHITKFVVVKKNNVLEKLLKIKLKYRTIVLDSIVLKKHNLSGRLGIDTKDVPFNKKDSLLREVMNLSDVDMNVVGPIDEIDKAKPPLNNTDPTVNFAGAGASVTMAFKHSERLWALRKELARKKDFPYKIMSELGEKFFFEQLKIPVENYFHFLEYCNPLGIEKLHKEDKVLDIIKVFRRESKTYLEVIKKE